MDSLGTRVRFYRQLAEMTQTKLAKDVKVAPAYISQIEADQRVPSIKVLERLAETLKVDIWVLMRPRQFGHKMSNSEKIELLRALILTIHMEAA